MGLPLLLVVMPRASPKGYGFGPGWVIKRRLLLRWTHPLLQVVLTRCGARKPVVSLTLGVNPRYHFCFRLRSLGRSLGADVRVIIR